MRAEHNIFADTQAANKQAYAAQFLARLRETGLHEAVAAAASMVEPKLLRAQILEHVPSGGLAVLQGTGLRDEQVFAVPIMFERSPGILAYYRLLLGVSQKRFYAAQSRLAIFKPMEVRQNIPLRAADSLDYLCGALNQMITTLLERLPAGSLPVNISQLPLLTLGAQIDGSWRAHVGLVAAEEVFEALKDVVRAAAAQHQEGRDSISVCNSSGRQATLSIAADPDLVVRESFGDSEIYKAAVEVKGGGDYANIHNRVGEAEKSHQKARLLGAGDFWTIINLTGADLNKLRQESPTTREWINIVDVRRRSGPGWERLVQLICAAMGI